LTTEGGPAAPGSDEEKDEDEENIGDQKEKDLEKKYKNKKQQYLTNK